MLLNGASELPFETCSASLQSYSGDAGFQILSRLQQDLQYFLKNSHLLLNSFKMQIIKRTSSFDATGKKILF